MAKYQVTLQDAWPFLKRRLLRSAATASLVILAGSLAFVAMGGPASLTAFGVGIGLAIGVISDAYVEYQRTRRSYLAADSVEMSVGPDELVFATDLRHTTIRRSPRVSVIESYGAFVITVGSGTSPVLVPIRYLTPVEVDILRQWMTA